MTTVKLKNNIPSVQKQVDEAMTRALVRACIDVDLSAKMNCPVDTGRLRASISYSINGSGSEGFDTVQTSEAEDHSIKSQVGSAIVGTNVVYAKAIEYGHSKKAPQGFLRRALDENESKIKTIVIQEFKDIGK